MRKHFRGIKRFGARDKLVNLSLRQPTLILGLNLSKSCITSIKPDTRLDFLTLVFRERSASNRAGDILIHHLVLFSDIKGFLALNRHRGIVHLITESEINRIKPISQILADYIGIGKSSIQSRKIITKLLASLGLTLIESATAGFISLSLDKVDLSLLSCKAKSTLKPHVGIINVGG